jgi:hypothetical protein
MNQVAIYEKEGSQCIVHITSSIEDAAAWLNCTSRALYYSLHIDGVMNHGDYIVERINIEEGEDYEVE